MTVNDDFSPMVDQGELEPASGLLGRVRRRHDLRPVEAGFVRVLIVEDGSPILAHDLTGGERQWGRPRSWIKVDVSHHTLDYPVAFSDPTSRAGFVAHVSVRAFVREAAEVARQGIVSVKDFLLPAVQRVVKQASSEIEPTRDPDPIVVLAAMRTQADVHVRRAVQGAVRDVPDWLDAEFVSVTLGFDDETQQHHAELVNRTRQGELIDVNKVNEEKEAKAALAVRALWRNDLLPHLSDPSRRVFEVAFGNPTPQNLARAVEQVSATELQLLSHGFDLLTKMVDKDYVDKDDPFYAAIVAMSGKVANHLYLPGAAGGLSSLPTGDGKQREEAVDHEPSEVVEEDEDEKGDRDWSDD
jgi:hypothetical protein